MLIDESAKEHRTPLVPPPVPERRGRWRRTRSGRVLETAPFDPDGSDEVAPPKARPRTSVLDAVADWNVEATHRLEGFELRSVARVAVRYYACALAVLSAGVVLAWLAAVVLGLVGRAEEFMRSIGFREFSFVGFEVIAGGILLSVAAVGFLTTMTVLAAAFYNLLRRPGREVGVRLVPVSAEGPVASDPDVPTGNGHHNGAGNGAQ